MNDNTITNTLSDHELDARLRTTFATVMPLLDFRRQQRPIPVSEMIPNSTTTL